MNKIPVAAIAILVLSSVLAAMVFVMPRRVGAMDLGPDAYGYTLDDTVPYSWIPATGTVVADFPSNCEDPPGSPDFTFSNFQFYNVSYTDILVCPNGFVKFAGAFDSAFNANGRLPYPTLPNADIVAIAANELNPTIVGSGKIYFDKQATQTVVTWDSVSTPTYGKLQFQIILKNTGTIDIQYAGIHPSLAGRVSGIENSLGDIGLQYSSASGPGSLTNGTTVRYIPPSPMVPDQLTISGEDMSPPTSMQRTTVILERYTLQVATGAVGIAQFVMQTLGTLGDSRLSLRIFNDTNDNRQYDFSVDGTILNPTQPVGGFVYANFTPPRVLRPENIQRWLIVVDCLCSATVGATLGFRISGAIPSMTLAGFDTVSYSPGSPIDSSLTTITEFPVSTLSLSFTDRAPATVNQGQEDILMLEATAEVDTGLVIVNQINLTLIGIPPRDADVPRAFVAADDNNDGLLNPMVDRVLGWNSFTGGKASVYPNLWVEAGPAKKVRLLFGLDISGAALDGDTVGLSVTSPAEIVMNICNNRVSPTGFPAASGESLIVAKAPNTVTITSWTSRAPATAYQGDTNIVMANFTMAVDSGKARFSWDDYINFTLTGVPPDINDIGGMGLVELWIDFDSDGSITPWLDIRVGAGGFTGGPPFDWIAVVYPDESDITIYAGAPRDFLAVLAISGVATVGNSVGLRVDNESSASFNTHTVLSPTNLPLQSANSIIAASASDTVTLSIVDHAPPSMAPFERGVLMGSVDLQVPVGIGSNYVETKGLGIMLIGSCSDSDVAAVGVYLDIDKNGLLDKSVDRLLGASLFTGGYTSVYFNEIGYGLAGIKVFGGATESLLLVIDVSPVATPLVTIALGITAANQVFIDETTGDSVSPVGFPMATGLSTISGTPVIPSLNSPFTFSPPKIDGNLTSGEWADALSVDLMEVMGNSMQAYLYVKNDATNLYLAYDVVGDQTIEFYDVAYASFDTGNDAVATPGHEDSFSTGPSGSFYQNHWVCYAPGGWDFEDAPFDRTLPNHGMLDLMRGSGPSLLEKALHPMIEFQIPLALIGAVPGGMTGFALASVPGAPYYSGLADNTYSGKASWPLDFTLRPGATLEEYGDLVLGPQPPSYVTVSGVSKAPPIVTHDSRDVVMELITLTADVPSATLTALNATLIGTAADSDIESIRLFDDVNDNGLLDLGVDMQLGRDLTFAGGHANFTGFTKAITQGTPENLLIVYNISLAATSSLSVGVQFANPEAFTLADYGRVSGTFPLQSATSLIDTRPTLSGLGVNGFLALTPAIMHIVTPPDNPDFNWTYFDEESQAQQQYHIQVEVVSNGTIMWDLHGIGGASVITYAGAPLVDGVTYYYRINAQDGYDWGPWSQIQFRINTPPSGPASAVSPPDDAIVPASGAQMVGWQLSADPEGDPIEYTWEVEENGTCTFGSLISSGVTFSDTSDLFATAVSSAYCWRVSASDGWEDSGWSVAWNFTTNAMVNSPPLLSLPSVTPSSGGLATSFLYTVLYTDPDNDAPASGEPLLWINKGGFLISGAPFITVPGAWVGAVNDYVAGRWFSYATVLPSVGSNYAYYFTAIDAWGAGDTTAEAYAPDVMSTAPVLGWLGTGNYATDGLDPEVGGLSTAFTFMVVYSDADNDAPTNIDVLVEKPVGTPLMALPMMLSSWVGAPGDYAAGATYSGTTSMPSTGTDYAYRFNASDGINWATGVPTAAIDAPNIEDPPVAVASVSPGPYGFRDTVFTFDASGSSDDLGIVSWLWDFGDGDTDTTMVAQHTYSSTGTMAVSLTVWDASDQLDTDTLTVEISNYQPVPVIGIATSATGNLSTTFGFDGSASSDRDGSIVSYDWDFGDGGTWSGITASHLYTQRRSFTVNLTVTDNNGAVNATSLIVDVLNRPPVINTATPHENAVSVKAESRLTLRVTATDPDLDALSHSWTVDGTPVGTDSRSYSFVSTDVGSHDVQVTVSDGNGTATHTWQVEVTSAGQPGSDLLLPIIIVVVIVAAIIIVLLILRRRKKATAGIRNLPPSPPEGGQTPPGAAAPPPLSPDQGSAPPQSPPA